MTQQKNESYDLKEFNVINYPDGHKHIKHDIDLHGVECLSASIKSFDDLFLIAQIKKIYPEFTHLYIKYLLAARCDRRFSTGETIDLEIVCDFINGLSFEKVSVLRPHNEEKTQQLLKSKEVIIKDVTVELLDMMPTFFMHPHHTITVWPDKNARTNIKKHIERKLHYPHILCEKKRIDKNKINIVINNDDKEIIINYRNIIIIDDLCDGGNTFVEIVKQLKAIHPTIKIILVITHAIFSKGIDVFNGLIDEIYCTDSYATFQSTEHIKIHQLGV